ncbi:MAG: hypothetical protein ACJ72J_06765 [Nitrososphaeraceae archaeon]
MAKTFSAFYLGSSILAIMLLVVFIGSNGNYASYNKAFAAINASSILSIPKAKQDTFSAIGTISSLVITVPPPAKSTASGASGFNITNAFKVILTGEWNLSVRKGNVTNFAANFLASPMDGSKPHIHQITNFQKASITRQQQIVQLTSDNTVSINGTVDVKINGVIVWHNAHVSILILKGNTIAIRLNDKDTEDHFGAQPVLGVVNRLIM